MYVLIYQMFHNKQVLVLQPKKMYIIFMVKGSRLDITYC